MKLSIVIPVYNEEKTIIELLNRVIAASLNLEKEIIIIDDGSTDNSPSLISKFIESSNADIKLIRKENGGKGSAVRKGIESTTGEICIVQDADLEYDPNDYQACINPIINKEYEVIYGSRMLKKENAKHSSWSFYIGGKIITAVTNFLYKSKLTDEPTCYKTFSTKIIKKFKIESDGFEWEPEITAKILKAGIKIGEVPINYYPRKISEGKKIRWRDGIKAILYLIKYRFTN